MLDCLIISLSGFITYITPLLDRMLGQATSEKGNLFHDQPRLLCPWFGHSFWFSHLWPVYQRYYGLYVTRRTDLGKISLLGSYFTDRCLHWGRYLDLNILFTSINNKGYDECIIILSLYWSQDQEHGIIKNELKKLYLLSFQ